MLDAAGTQSSLDRATELVRPGGTVGILGTYWDPVSLGMSFQMKELTLIPSFTYGHHHGTGEFAEASRILAAVPDLPDALVTHRFGLDDAAEAFRVAGDRGRGLHQGGRPPLDRTGPAAHGRPCDRVATPLQPSRR